MKFAIVMLMSTLLMGGVAQARSCPATHGRSFCKVHAQRVAVQAYRSKLAVQIKRTHYAVHLRPMRKLAWKWSAVHKANLWTRHMVKVVRALPTFVTVQQPANWLCIHHYEGAWNDTGDPFWGGLQMDREFMGTYGGDMIKKYGGYANLWSPRDQMIVAQRAYDAGRGFHPWPNTARYCGLL